jgi:hypothetical protein
MGKVTKKILNWCGETASSMKKQISTKTAYQAGKVMGNKMRGKKL